MPKQTPTVASVPTLTLNLSEIPALLDHAGINKYLVPIGRTTLYELAASGEIQSASIGVKRGSRVFVTSTVVEWLQKRLASTKRPKMGGHQSDNANSVVGAGA